MRPKSGQPIVISGFSAQEALSVAFAALGMYVLVTALPQLGRRVAAVFWVHGQFSTFWDNRDWQIGFWVDIAQVVIGLWLVLGMRGIARVVRSFQDRGIPEDSSISSDAST